MRARWLEVLAFDPGGTTGWAWVRVPARRGATVAELVQDEEGLVKSGQLVGEELAQAQEMCELVREFGRAAVVSERFVIRQFNQSKEFLAPVRLNAILEFYCFGSDRVLHWQGPAVAKTRWTDDRLKTVGLHSGARLKRLGGGPHATDALRHALTLISRCLNEEFLYKQVVG